MSRGYRSPAAPPRPVMPTNIDLTQPVFERTWPRDVAKALGASSTEDEDDESGDSVPWQHMPGIRLP